MAKPIIVPDPEWGTPWAAHDVFYYTLHGNGRVSEDAGMDSDVDGRRVEKMELKPNEAAQAICKQHPHRPVTWVYGSERMREAMTAHSGAERALRE